MTKSCENGRLIAFRGKGIFKLQRILAKKCMPENFGMCFPRREQDFELPQISFGRWEGKYRPFCPFDKKGRKKDSVKHSPTFSGAVSCLLMQ